MEAHVHEQLVQGCYLAVLQVSRTSDLMVISLACYLYATKTLTICFVVLCFFVIYCSLR